MSHSFKNTRVLITGASKGLGKAAAVAFEREGAKLALVARSGDKLEELKHSFVTPDDHLIFGLDLLDSENVNTVSKTLLTKWDGVDVALHCIGGSLGVNDALVEWKDFVKCFKGNIGIASELNRQLVPRMKAQGHGNIIHIGSIVSSEARASVPYNTVKAALAGYVRSLGKQLAEEGIIVSGILPGAFYGDDNAMFRYEYYKREEYREFVKTLPEGRIPNAREYVPILFLLANPESKIVSGSLIAMDGAQGQAYYHYSG